MADTVTLLDSDEDTPKEAMYKKRKVVTVWPCVNMECKSGQEKKKMMTADQYSVMKHLCEKFLVHILYKFLI